MPRAAAARHSGPVVEELRWSGTRESPRVRWRSGGIRERQEGEFQRDHAGGPRSRSTATRDAARRLDVRVGHG